MDRRSGCAAGPRGDGGGDPPAGRRDGGSRDAARPSTPEVAFLGDSWTVGVGATDDHGYAPFAAERLGWEYDVLGVSGSGSRGGGGSYAERVDATVAVGADLIVVQGSLNDSGVDPRQLDRGRRRTPWPDSGRRPAPEPPSSSSVPRTRRERSRR